MVRSCNFVNSWNLKWCHKSWKSLLTSNNSLMLGTGRHQFRLPLEIQSAKWSSTQQFLCRSKSPRTNQDFQVKKNIPALIIIRVFTTLPGRQQTTCFSKGHPLSTSKTSTATTTDTIKAVVRLRRSRWFVRSAATYSPQGMRGVGIYWRDPRQMISSNT